MSSPRNRASPDAAAHMSRPWRVHSLAADFALHDVWEFPIDADPRRESFADFYRVFTERALRFDAKPLYSFWPRSSRDALHLFRMGALGVLIGVRRLLGRLFRWDHPAEPLAIPDHAESSVGERLSDEDRARNRSSGPRSGPFDFDTVYVFEHEALHEVSNKTIHALLHLSWVPDGDRSQVWMAVYVKSRGWQSDAYMALIKPFRYAFVYPALIEHMVRTWEAQRESGEGV